VELLLGLGLSDELGEAVRAELQLILGVVVERVGGDKAVGIGVDWLHCGDGRRFQAMSQSN